MKKEEIKQEMLLFLNLLVQLDTVRSISLCLTLGCLKIKLIYYFGWENRTAHIHSPVLPQTAKCLPGSAEERFRVQTSTGNEKENPSHLCQ